MTVIQCTVFVAMLVMYIVLHGCLPRGRDRVLEIAPDLCLVSLSSVPGGDCISSLLRLGGELLSKESTLSCLPPEYISVQSLKILRSYHPRLVTGKEVCNW